ncbi:636_t:CDS:1, partial [Gigaspora margarita]
ESSARIDEQITEMSLQEGKPVSKNLSLEELWFYVIPDSIWR